MLVAIASINIGNVNIVIGSKRDIGSQSTMILYSAPNIEEAAPVSNADMLMISIRSGLCITPTAAYAPRHSALDLV